MDTDNEINRKIIAIDANVKLNNNQPVIEPLIRKSSVSIVRHAYADDDDDDVDDDIIKKPDLVRQSEYLAKCRRKSVLKTHQPVLARTVLWHLTFVGFIVHYMVRINMNIAIVDMVISVKNNSQIGLECVDNNDYDKSESIKISRLADQTRAIPQKKNSTRPGRFSLERMAFDYFNIKYRRTGFKWNEYQQGLMLASFFWLHGVSHVPGGILASKYGSKVVFGVSNLICSLLCIIMPTCAFLDIRLLLGVRVLQGCISGLAWPAMHTMTAKWIPPNERSKFVSAYQGSSLGIALLYPVFGFVITWTTWEWVFHLCAILGIIWYFCWQYFVFDTPVQHPRIQPEELNYIEESLSGTIHDSSSIPWRDIICSRAVWMNIIAQFGWTWALYTLMTQAPTYFNVIHGWSLAKIGFLSGVPHLIRLVFAYNFAAFGDYLLRKKKMTRTNVRKLATSICCIMGGIFIIALSYSGCSTLLAIIFLSLAITVQGGISAGTLSSLLDLSPNFSGITLGLTGMFVTIPGFLSPIIVGNMTFNNTNIHQWKIVFQIAAGISIFCGILYALFSESNLQIWNTPEEHRSSIDKERENELEIKKWRGLPAPDG